MAKRKKSGSTQFRVEGLDDLIEKLNTLTKGAYPLLKATLYPGAGLLADEIRKRCPTESLRNALTISKMRLSGGEISAAITFGGYDENGFPLPELAAIFESGTSDRSTRAGYARGKVKKHPFMRPAVNAAKERVTEAMREEMEKQINKIMED